MFPLPAQIYTESYLRTPELFGYLLYNMCLSRDITFKIGTGKRTLKAWFFLNRPNKLVFKKEI